MLGKKCLHFNNYFKKEKKVVKTNKKACRFIMLNHMAEEGWCVQLALNAEDFWVFMVHDRRPVHYTVASVITELVKWCWEVTLSLLCLRCPTLRCFPYGAGCRSVRRTAQSAPSPAALPAPSACFTVEHGSGKGEIGHEHNYG